MKAFSALTVWLLLAAAAVWLLVLSIAYEPDASPIAPTATAEQQSKSVAIAGPSQLLLSDFGATLERPLFARSRRPYVATPEPVVAEPEPPPPPEIAPSTEVPAPDGLVLSGITISGGMRRALFVTATQPMGVWLGLGDSLEGWRISEINSGSAVLQVGEQKLTLNLYVEKPIE